LVYEKKVCKINPMLAKTKIVATLGPASDSEAKIKELVKVGVNVFRLNFSHGSHQEHLENVYKIRKVATRLGKNVAIIQDLSGPKIRLGQLYQSPMTLKTGEVVRLISGRKSERAGLLPVSYPKLAKELKKGDLILLGDGEIELKVMEIDANKVLCKVRVGGEVSSKKGVNLPSEKLSVSALTSKDREDLSLGIKAGVDYIALSFVRGAREINLLRRLVRKEGKDIPIIAKIETLSAVKNFDQIIQCSDGVMVARGDLGVEIPLEQIPALQKEIIQKANLSARPVITATQMLRSMVESRRPTRAEVTDVANAIYDGTDAVMLSEETAVGRYPVEAVRMMTRIAWQAEENLAKFCKRAGIGAELGGAKTIPEAISLSAFQMSEELNAKAIVTPTRTGYTTRLVSRFRPEARILALSPGADTVKKLSLVWGAESYLVPDMENAPDLLNLARDYAQKILKLKKGDVVVITAGLPITTPPNTNLVKLEQI